MSCYFRHLKTLFDEAGIDITPGNRQQIDQAVHRLVGVGHKDCPAAWKRLKEELADDRRRRGLAARLRGALSELQT